MAALDPLIIFLVAAALMAGGLVKGIVGLGLPIVALSLLSSLIPIHLSLALLTLPIVTSNLWQSLRTGRLHEPLKRFWPMILALIIGLWISAQLVVDLSPEVLYLVVGLVVMVFTLLSYFNPRFTLSPAAERWASPLAGAIGGILGGLSTMWGPPMTMVLVSLKLEKDAFVRAVGLIWFCGSLPLLLAYIKNGLLNVETAPWSLAACLPVVAGFWIGERIRNRIDQDTFRKVLLIFLFLLGVNLVRRAVF